jgi:hypothetical protein
MLSSYDVTEWNGGKIHRISSSVYHLMRGQIFNIDGSAFFTMGGASSHDKEHRTENKSWWVAEIPSSDEFEEAMTNLDKCCWNVDYIISHCIGDTIQSSIAYWYEHDKITNFFEVVRQDCKYQHWYFGHYHIDKDIDTKHTAMYNKIRRIV